MRTMTKDQKRSVQQTALAVTKWIGSPASVIVHTILFMGCFVATYFGILEFERMLLILTTIVSLEAIYLAIFIQMTINYQAQAIAEVEQDIDEIQEDVQEMQEDVGEIQEDVEEISEDMGEVQKDVDELQEDVEEMSEEEKAEEVAEGKRKEEQRETLESIETNLQKLMEDIAHLKQTRKPVDGKPMF